MRLAAVISCCLAPQPAFASLLGEWCDAGGQEVIVAQDSDEIWEFQVCSWQAPPPPDARTHSSVIYCHQPFQGDDGAILEINPRSFDFDLELDGPDGLNLRYSRNEAFQQFTRCAG